MGNKHTDSKSSGAAPGSEIAADPSAVEPRFAELLTRLRSLVDKLERGSLPLEEGLRLFEEGMDLCRRGGETLDRAEKKSRC
jgi:exodeoxyribonuclease VII small subunit